MNRLRTLVSSAVTIFTLAFGASLAYGQITPSADAYTNSAAPTTNYGASVLLDVDGATQAAYIQFNLASIPSSYTSADITKATLKIYVNTVPTAGSFNVDYVNGTWAENTITHSLAPALGTTIAGSVPITTADKNQFILIDVTAAVQAWLSGTTNDGIALVANGTFNATFDSKESTSTSHAPELDIVFAGGTGLAGVTTATGSGLTGGGTSGTLNLGLLNTCTSGQVLQWSGTAWACATPKGSGTVTKVATGAGLTGGPITGSGTLSIATGGVTNAMLADSYAQLNANNTFTVNQTVNGQFTVNSNTISIIGDTSSTTGQPGVLGSATATTGNTTGVEGVSLSSAGAGVVGVNGAGTGNAVGVIGTTESTSGFGVVGTQGGATVVAGNPAGVYGATAAPVGFGVQGTSPNWIGVYGSGATGVAGATQSPSGFAVWGSANSPTGTTAGVFGETGSTAGYGVEGQSLSSSGATAGVYGTSASTGGFGVFGSDTAATGSTIGVVGEAASPGGFGVEGSSAFAGVVGFPGSFDFSTTGAPYGVVGSSSAVGVYGASSGFSSTAGIVIHNTGVWGDYGSATAGSGIGVLGTADDNLAGAFNNNSSAISTLYVENDVVGPGGEVFEGSIPSLGAGIFAIIGDPGCGPGFIALQLSHNGMSNCNNYTLTAGSDGQSYLNAVAGETVHLRVNNVDALRATNTGVAVAGTLSKGGGSFMIDHPLDPANKYLYHSFVESPDMKNIYDGTITTDGAGFATVALPDWFEALNRDFRYQLTVIGQFAQAIVASKVANNQFRIQTDKPNVEVSWQVTGIRQDAFANANRIPVEVEKAPADRGRYLYPEAVGLPTSARIGYDTPPPSSEHVVRQRPTLARRSDASPMIGRAPLSPPTVPAPAMRKPIPPQSIEPHPTMPLVAPLPHPAALVSKPEVNQK